MIRPSHIKVIKVALAAALVACLFQMPYGYYQLVRLVTFVVMSYFAVDAFKREGASLTTFAYAGTALLFQPFVKIALGRPLWNIVDLLLAATLIYSSFIRIYK